MSERVYVADADELSSGDRKIVEVGGTQVGVLNYEGELYAIQNRCAHDGGPVCKGLVQGRLDGDWPGPGERVEEDFTDEPVIACPWHGWEYELETGDHVGDPRISLRTYEVTEEDGAIYLE